MKLSEIAKIIDGIHYGNEVEIEGVSDLKYQKSGTIVYVESQKFLNDIENSPASAILLPEGLASSKKPYISTKNPKKAFAKLLEIFNKYKDLKPILKKSSSFEGVFLEDNVKLEKGVFLFPFTTILSGTIIGENTIVYSNCFIGRDVKIGKNCIIKSGVRIDSNIEIGDNVIIHHNVVIGGDGFGYYQENEINYKIPQIGSIKIGNNVEIGAGVTIDRATIGETIIKDGVKIDNLVHIAHNVHIGANSIIVAQVGIAGSTVIGKNCIFAGQVGIADHVEIGDNVVVLAQSGVESKAKISSGEILFGTPARPVMEEKRIIASLGKLPEMIKRLKRIEKKLGIDDE